MRRSSSEGITCFLCDFWWLILLILAVLLAIGLTYPYWGPALGMGGTPPAVPQDLPPGLDPAGDPAGEPTAVQADPVESPTVSAEIPVLDPTATLVAQATLESLVTPAPQTTPQDTPQAAPAVGSLAPDFTRKNPDGTQVTLSDLKGKPVLLFIFGTWCPYCKQEAPLLQKMQAKYQAQGLQILALDTSINDQSTISTDLQNFADTAGWTFQTVVDINDQIMPLYRINGVPANFFIDANGIIRDVEAGAIIDEASLEARIKTLLGA
jgi:cytochrome c biogenesis protein CcmG, thiol:disulfide interchange protein DsbE